MREIKITENEQSQRIDKFLLKYLNKAPKSFIFKMLRKKNIKVNDKKVAENYILEKNDVVTLYLSEETIQNFKEEQSDVMFAKPIDIIFEDNNILIINKPSGVLSQSNSKDTADDMVKRVAYYLSKGDNFKENIELGFKPSISNRLDINTSGIIVCGKNQSSVIALNDAIKNQKVNKYYYVLVKGYVTESKTLYGYHTKDEINNIVVIKEHRPLHTDSSEVITKYEPISTNTLYSLLKITLITGKSHQIRAHLKSVGLSVVGDRKYGDDDVNKYFRQHYGVSNQLLHAIEVSFDELPETISYLSNKSFNAPIPQKFSSVINKLF